MAWYHQATNFFIWTNVYQIISRLLSDAMWHHNGLMGWSLDDLCRSPRLNELNHRKYLKVIDVMVNPSCPKALQTPYWEHTMKHVGMLAYIGLLVTLQFPWYGIQQKFNLVKWGVELKMNWLNWSIPISSGSQFQFKIFQLNSNSIHVELNWIDYQFQFNSWIDPSPANQLFWMDQMKLPTQHAAAVSNGRLSTQVWRPGNFGRPSTPSISLWCWTAQQPMEPQQGIHHRVDKTPPSWRVLAVRFSHQCQHLSTRLHWSTLCPCGLCCSNGWTRVWRFPMPRPGRLHSQLFLFPEMTHHPGGQTRRLGLQRDDPGRRSDGPGLL